MENIGVPVAVAERFVLVDPKLISGLAVLKHLPVILFIKQRGELTLIIDNDLIKRSFQTESAFRTFVDPERFFFRSRLCTAKNHIPLGRNALHIGNCPVCCLLDRINVRTVCQCTAVESRKLYQIVSLMAQGIPYRNGLFLLIGKTGQTLVDQLPGGLLDIGVFFFRLVVYFFNRRTRQDVVELVGQDQLPHTIQFALWISRSLFSGHLCQNREKLQFHHGILTLTIGALVSRHGGISSTMIFKVQFTDPFRQSFVILYALPELVKILNGKGLTDLGNTLDPLIHTAGHFHHVSGRAAASVTVTKADPNIVVDILILIAVPAAHDGIRVEHAVIGRKEAAF